MNYLEEQKLSTLSIETIFTLSKKSLFDSANTFAIQVVSNGEDAIRLIEQITQIEYYLGTLKEALKKTAITQLVYENGKKNSDFSTIEIYNKTSYDFSDSTAYKIVSNELEKAKQTLKEIEGISKKVSTVVEWVNPSDGEVLTIYPAQKLQEENLKVTLR